MAKPTKIFGRREYRLWGTTFSPQTARRQKALLELRDYHVQEEITHGVHLLWVIPKSKFISDRELRKLPMRNGSC